MARKFETTVVGMQHRITPSTRRMLRARIEKSGPLEVLLIREHDNVHDENAIKVVMRKGAYKGMHVGYLSRQVVSEYAPALDELRIRITRAHITAVNVDDGTASLLIQFVKVRKS